MTSSARYHRLCFGAVGDGPSLGPPHAPRRGLARSYVTSAVHRRALPWRREEAASPAVRRLRDQQEIN
ncbi:hypothetical protein NDU88_003152 [Pleurodeles waltl]|uniref:Uncharacterized protein n=1 Tax=Pleurodeles waltl TaxID=8319 RepID=A0AAV7KU19_PLEWA|nr:hypothetical protein NDU88_003152 [Pleurodeles waltl]